MENPLTSVQLCLEPIKFLFVFLKLASIQDDLFQFYFQVPPRLGLEAFCLRHSPDVCLPVRHA